MKQKNLFIAAIGILVIAFFVGAFFYQKQQSEQAAQRAAQNLAVLVRAGAPSFGNPDAAVHIVEFFDPACDTCREFYPMVKALMAEHPGKIRLTMRYAPFHPGSEPVVRALEAARKQGQFRQTLEALFASQNDWVRNHTAYVDSIWRALDPLGLDMARLQNDMNSPEISATIARDVADAKTMNVTATPEYFVNGKPLPSFGFDQLRSLVGEALLASNSK